MVDVADYAAKLTCRSRLTLLPVIRNKFRGTPRIELFRSTCFGWLLDLDDMQENCCLIHHFSCHQLLRDEGDTEIVPFTYSINNVEVQFGREEFCLVTGFRFGIDFRSDYESGPNPFRRRVFDSSSDGREITVQMLLEKFNSKEFDNLNDLDAVRISLLCVLETVLIGHELRYRVPGWCFRLVENIDAWNIYPWGSYVWTTLYGQLRDAIKLRWEAHFVARDSKKGPPKYSMMGFMWAFKTWILEAFREGALIYFEHRAGYPRSVAWRFGKRFVRQHIENFLDTNVNQHRPRLTPNDVEAAAQWWRLSKSFFDGDITVPPVIPPPKNQHSRDDNLWKEPDDLTVN